MVEFAQQIAKNGVSQVDSAGEQEMDVEYADFEHRQRQMAECASATGRSPSWVRDLEYRTGIPADDIVAAGAESPQALARLIFDGDGNLRRIGSFGHWTPKEAQRWADTYYRRQLSTLTGEEARRKVAELDRPASADPQARQAWIAAKQRPASSDPAARVAWLQSIR